MMNVKLTDQRGLPYMATKVTQTLTADLAPAPVPPLHTFSRTLGLCFVDFARCRHVAKSKLKKR